jgi:hypothetical protein
MQCTCNHYFHSFLFQCKICFGDQLFFGVSGYGLVLVLILYILRHISSAYLVNGELLTFLVLLSHPCKGIIISHIYLMGEICYLLYFSSKKLVGITLMFKKYINTYRILVNKHFWGYRLSRYTITTETHLNLFTPGARMHSGICQMRLGNINFVPSDVY